MATNTPRPQRATAGQTSKYAGYSVVTFPQLRKHSIVKTSLINIDPLSPVGAQVGNIKAYGERKKLMIIKTATILAASKIFCHGINSQIHEKIISFFISLVDIDPILIYIAQFSAEENLQKSVNVRSLMGSIDSSTSIILVNREHDFDDESMMTFSSS